MAKRRKVVEGMYVLTKDPLLVMNGDKSTIVSVTPELLQELNNLVIERTKFFKKKKELSDVKSFFVHLAPNVSFYIKYE